MKSKLITVFFIFLFNLPLIAQVELSPASRLLWGYSKTHCVTDDYAFISAGGAVLIADIISTDSMEVLNYFYLPTIVNDIYVENDILYALDLQKGLYIYNISDIFNPVLISDLDLGNYCYDFLCDANYVYVALGNNGIKKINVTDLSNPYIENESDTRAYTIQKYQSYLYCFAGDDYTVCDSISILYASDLVQGGTFYAEGYFSFIQGVFFNDHNGFLLENFAGPSGQESVAGFLTVLDLTNPLNPQRLGHVTIYDDYFYKGICLGDTVLAFSYGNLVMIDASNSYFPAIISQNPNVLLNSGSYGYISITFPELYISYDYGGGFLIVDISDLLNPASGYYLSTNNNTEVVWLKDSLLYAGGNGIYTADISDMNNPVLLRRENTGTVRDIKIVDSLLYAASNTFKIFKIHGSDSLILYSELNYGSESSQVAVDGDLAAAGGRYWGLHLIDITDPSNPQYIRSVPLPAGLFYIKHMALQNNKLIVSDYQLNTPVIYDVSDPNNPVIKYEGNYGTTAFCISESDTVLFVGDWDTYELVVLNIADLNNTYEISRIPVMSYPLRVEDMFTRGNYLFITCFGNRSYFRMYDVSDLQNITDLGYAFLPEWAISICANDYIAAVSDTYDGIYIYDISNLIPVELSGFNSFVDGDKVYLNWITSTETNNLGFEIQRCQNSDYGESSGWGKIGFVEGNGTTTKTQTYSFTDTGLKTGSYSYRLKQIDFDGSFEYSQILKVEIGKPEKFVLSQNYPNPFNPTTSIKISIPTETNVKLSIFNLLGEKVKEIKNEIMKPGNYEIEFNASDLASGIYFYSIKAGGFVDTKKMLLVR